MREPRRRFFVLWRCLLSWRLYAWLPVLIGAVSVSFAASLALAQSAPHVTTSVSDQHPEVGAPFMVELVVTGSEPFRSVSSPQLSVPSGFSASGPSQSTRTEMRIINGTSTSSSSVVLSWVLTASQPGSVTIPAPTVVVDGSSLAGHSLTFEVVPATGAARPPPGFPSPFMSLGPTSPFDLNDLPDDPGAPPTTDELALPTAPDERIFLRAIADHTQAYLGQQVTLSFYVYYRVDFQMTERKEAPLSDFLRVSLLTDPGSTTAQYTRVGGKRYGARLIDRIAVFPLKSGKLDTGSISARFQGRDIGVNVLRVSNDLTIDVSEPPKDGRPPGYNLGDVGHFAVSATVEPRQALQGSSVSVTVKVEGVGNVPGAVHMPQQKGVEWLDPERKDALTTKDGKIGGTRTFGYVATLKNSGKIDLGEIVLPYFNPDTKAYEITEAKIGEIDVIPTDPKPDDIRRAKQGDEDLLAKIPNGRTTLGAFAVPHEAKLPTWSLASAIAAPPLFVAFGLVLGFVGGGIRRRRREQLGSARSLVKEALEDARLAEKEGDVKRLSQSVERAVHAAVEACTGVASRGVLRTSLGDELAKHGVDKVLAADIVETLALCEDLRFSPTADAGETNALIGRTKGLVKRLEHKGSPDKGSPEKGSPEKSSPEKGSSEKSSSAKEQASAEKTAAEKDATDTSKTEQPSADESPKDSDVED